MGGGLTGRERELEFAQSVLQQASDGPAALIIEGQAGIGKTTLCRSLAENLAASGFTALTTTGAAAEVSLAWAALADLLAGIDEAALSGISALHQQALQAVESGLDGPGGDERLVASAFRSAVEQQSRRQPVLIVLDDAQWIDEASRLALGFAIRRLKGRVSVVAAFRTGHTGAVDTSWLQPPDPQARTTMTLGPMSLADMQTAVDARRGPTLARQTVARIHSISGGNPFYALELARAIGDEPDSDVESLPPTLAGLVRDRIGTLDSARAEAMVTIAAAFEPTVDVIAAAIGRRPAELVDVLQPLESRGLLVFDGPRIRFTHPLITSGIITNADPAIVRTAHRRLAEIVEHPESRARHMALSSPHGDPETLDALDFAAEHAAAKGAYGTAAELLTLAVNRCGDTHWRRLRGADFSFRAGALDDAEALAAPTIEDLPAGFLRTAGLLLIAAIRGYRDGLASATELLHRAVDEAGEDMALRTQALLALTLAVGAAGGKRRCVDLARRARADAEATGMPELRSQALALWVYISFQYGLGTDSDALRSALELEDLSNPAPTTALQPSAVDAIISAWVGLLEESRVAMTAVLNRCEERGTELDVLWAAEQLTWINVALGRNAEAERIATDAVQRARQIGGQLPLITAYSARAIATAACGRPEETREAAMRAVDGATAAGLTYWVGPALTSLAFAEVSDGDYEQALQTMKPLLENFDADHDTEIRPGGWLPDAVEALTAVGRTEEAEPLVAALEANGGRLDRPWMLAVGARCRALVLAARGDLDSALQSAQRAMEHHDRLPMPFERARTQLLVGQLHRRCRHVQAAHDNLSAAAAVFEEIGSPLWAARANAELARLTARSVGATLTDSEQKVADLAASGLSNKEIAAKLYLSAKTVEMYLSNVYRKLGIRSRSQLADRLRDA